jgi:hypothetical protein
MAIESSGAISLGTTAGTDRSISAEFGGSVPHSLSEYYDKGNAPASGEITMGADFHGTSDAPTFRTTHTRGSLSVWRQEKIRWCNIGVAASNKFVAVFSDGASGSGYYLKAKVGTVNWSNNSITYGGSEITVYSGNSMGEYGHKIEFDPNNPNRFVLLYQAKSDSNDPAHAIIGIVSGDSITFGTPAVIQAGSVYRFDVDWDKGNANTFIVFYRDSSSGAGNRYGTVKVGTVSSGGSGTTISFGTSSSLSRPNGSEEINEVSIACDPNNTGRFVLVYYEQYSGDGCPPETSQYGVAVTGYNNNGSISFGTKNLFRPNERITMPNTSFCPDAAGKFVSTFVDNDDSNKAVACVGQVASSGTGTTVTMGSNATISTSVMDDLHMDVEPTYGTVLMCAYRDSANGNKGTLRMGTISGTSITFGTSDVYYDSAVQRERVMFDQNNAGKFIAVVKGSSSTNPSYWGNAVAGNCVQ